MRWMASFWSEGYRLHAKARVGARAENYFQGDEKMHTGWVEVAAHNTTKFTTQDSKLAWSKRCDLRGAMWCQLQAHEVKQCHKLWEEGSKTRGTNWMAFQKVS